jgi:hypothetical protein
MKNDGSVLESLVADLEALLLGTGFTVAGNDRVFDTEGNQLAEFDVTIEGRVGSTRFKWLIECRDRPSEGPAPASWIQQLAGRRRLFDFDKIVAVSTTGFSRGATDAARKLNVTLRTVISTTEISQQFGKIEFRMQQMRLSIPSDAKIGFALEDFPMVQSLGFVNDPEIRYKGENAFLGLRNFIERDYVNKKDIKDPENEERRELVFHEDAPMEFRVGTRIIPINQIFVPVEVEYSFHPVTVVTIKSYGESGKVIGEEITVTCETDDKIFNAVALITQKNGKVVVVKRGEYDVRCK